MTAFTFSSEIVDAVLRHMNTDHVDDGLDIVRAFARPDAISAVMTGLDGDGGTWLVVSPSGESEVRIPWSVPVTERASIRREVVVLHDVARKKLGLAPRSH